MDRRTPTHPFQRALHRARYSAAPMGSKPDRGDEDDGHDLHLQRHVRASPIFALRGRLAADAREGADGILVQLLHLLVYRRACRFFSSIVGDSRASWIHLSQSCVRQPRARTSVVGGIVSLGEEVRGRLAISSYLISRVYIEPCLTDLTVDSRIPHARLRVGRQGMPRAK